MPTYQVLASFAAPIPALHTAPRIMASAGEYELVGHKYKTGEPRCAEQLRQILERFLSTPFVGSSRNGSTLSRFPFQLPMASAHGPSLTCPGNDVRTACY